MIDMPADFTPLDPGRIQANDPLEIDYWSKQLGCSSQVLLETIERVGEHVTVVREALEARRTGEA